MPLFHSVLYVPWRGLNECGAGVREAVTRSVKKVPHQRVFLVEEQLRSTPRIGSWHERMSGREMLARVPSGHGVELSEGEETRTALHDARARRYPYQ